MAINLTPEQSQNEFATSILNQLRGTATALKTLLATGKDISGRQHPVPIEDMRKGFTSEQSDAIDQFMDLFAIVDPPQVKSKV